jgi:hypothetical protein
MTSYPLSIALVHHPVRNKNGDTITAAVTNLDVHDLSRCARTYGIETVFVVTPLEEQRRLIGQLVSHWVTGHGAAYNPKRRQALECVRIVDSMAAVSEALARRHGAAPMIVATAAKPPGATITPAAFREMLAGGTPAVLAFGTAWGLTPEFIQSADHVLAPIHGGGDYNHLSVRAAAAIIIDRLLGDR